MPDEIKVPPPGEGGAPAQQPGQPQVQQIQIPVDMSTLASGYVNWFRFTGSAEELIIDLGLTPQLGQLLTPQAGQPPPEPIKLTHRLVMNFFTAKRLLQNLQRAVGLYESHYGSLEVDPTRRPRIPQATTARPSGLGGT